MASQLIANQLRIPAIVVLIAVGLLVGPVTGFVTIPSDSEQISEFIGLGVAVILFEGAMDLRLGAFRRVGHGVGRLVILVVTGPTVIIPLLRQARMNKDSAALLKWEGIVNDPVAVLLATAWAPMSREDRTLLAWIAPRGIVAAATARLFGPALVEAGYEDASYLCPPCSWSSS